MSKSYEQEQEERSVTRDHNRALRISIRNTRKRQREEQERNDALYYALLESDASKDAATEAFGKLWRSGLFDCGPQDYDLMADIAIEALQRAKAAETQPVA